jgi:hypothetical protein
MATRQRDSRTQVAGTHAICIFDRRRPLRVAAALQNWPKFKSVSNPPHRPTELSPKPARHGELANRNLFVNGEHDVIKSRSERKIVMSDNDMKAELERLRQENAALKKGASDGLRMKVSEKGAVSVYGMGRFPVTLYKEQWLKLLNMADEIRAFIGENEARLKAKD